MCINFIWFFQMTKNRLLDQNITVLIKKLATDPHKGLNKLEVEKRLKLYGFNEVPEKKESYILKFLKKFWGITAWMLEIIIIFSWLLNRLIDFYIVTGLLITNAIISFTQESVTSNAIASLRKKLHIRVKTLRDGLWERLSAKQLVPGDIISIKVGDFVPADIKLLSGYLQIDQSALTGESLTKEKKINDAVYSGSIVRRGQAIGLVVETGLKTYFGKTIELVQAAAPEEHISRIISNITKWLIGLVGTIVFILFLISLQKGIPIADIVLLLFVLLLGAIPVALPAMFSTSMAIGARKLSRENVLVARLNAIEDAATLTVLCIDKTGTLTLNKLSVVQVVALNQHDKKDVLLFGALASQKESLDPIDRAFMDAAHHEHLTFSSYVKKEIIPFDPKTKRTGAIIEQKNGSFQVYKGALQLMLDDFHIPNNEAQKLLDYERTFAKKGFRTIAVARMGDSKYDMVGLVALEDLPRPESKKVLQKFKDLGITIKLLTGDALPIAKEIAMKVGIEGQAVDLSLQEDLFSTNPTEALNLINDKAIFAGIFPEDKYDIVKILQKEHQIVGMTGDGVNDAPALRQAEVGIAVSGATDVAKKAADVVLTQPGLYHMDDLIKTGRLIFQRVNTWIINKISRTTLKTGFITIAFLFTGNFVISSVEMLLLIFMTDFVKLSLATDKEKISKQPCQWDIFSLNRIGFTLGVVMICEALFLLFFALNYLLLPSHYLHTFSFEILFYFAVFSIFVVREREHFWHSMPSKTLLLSIFIDIIVSLLITTFGLFGFHPLPISYTFLVMIYAFFFSLVVNDWIKILLRTFFYRF
jgi:H+-transporting ATPase